jgi:ribulose-phosphate 3-epimerase
VAAIEQAGAPMLHLDVMDGHFVPNISFGVPIIKSLRTRSKLYFDAHLMIEEPRKYAQSFVEAGCDLITFHIEVAEDPAELVQYIHSLGASVGVSLNPTTPASSINGIIERVDMVLIMSVWPGFGGQKFIADVLPKLNEIKRRLTPHQRLQIDGGIDPTTIASAAAAGADTFVAGTAIFRQDDPPVAMRNLHVLAAASAGAS